MSIAGAIKSIVYVILVLIVTYFIWGVIFWIILGISSRKHTISETPASPVIENMDLKLKSQVVLRYYYPGGTGKEEVYRWFVVLENDEGDKSESIIPYWSREVCRRVSIQEMKEIKFDLSWVNNNMITVKSSKWPGVTWDAYVVSNYLHVYGKEGDVMASSFNENAQPLSEEMLGKLEPLKLNKDILQGIKFIDLSGYDPEYMRGAIINEDPSILLYFKNNHELSFKDILSVGPVLFEGSCYMSTIASSQWVLFNNSLTHDNVVYANHVYLNNNKGKLQAMNTSPVILTDTK